MLLSDNIHKTCLPQEGLKGEIIFFYFPRKIQSNKYAKNKEQTQAKILEAFAHIIV